MTNLQRETGLKRRPILLGIVVDVSNSMRRNWKNRDGRDMPRIQVVRDALNTQFRKANLVGRKNSRSIDIFCLGMGFKRTMYWSDVELSYGREKALDSDQKERTDVGVVCDLLALSEIIPSQSELKQLEQEIRGKWDRYTKHLLNRYIDFDESVYADLKLFIKEGIKASASRKLKRGLVYNLSVAISNKTVFDKYEILRNIRAKLAKYVNGWINRIAETSSKASNRYVLSTLQEMEKLYLQEIDDYEEFIRDTITDFVSDLVDNLILFLTLGFHAKDVVGFFDEGKVVGLATEIYNYLEAEVKKNIAIAWALHKGTLFLSSKSVRANLDTDQVQLLTGRCLQKYSWDILEKFVLDLVTNIFTAKFEEKAKAQMTDWLGLASSREISRTIKQITNILPDSIDKEFYSSEFMFGSTPISHAMNLAALRFQDISRRKREKILIIISDGEFDTNFPLDTATLLKSVGVRIICCNITPKDIMTALVKKKPSKWPIGAQKMLEMASTVSPDDEIIRDISSKGFVIPDGIKLFYQINQSDLLEDVFEAVLD